MSLGQWLTALRRGWPAITVMAVLGVAAAGLYLAQALPLYTAQTTVFFSFSRGGTASELNQGTTFAQGLVKSFAEVATTDRVLQPVIDELKLDATPGQLARRVQSVPSEDTVVLKLEVTDPSGATAARTADAIADQLRRSVAELIPSDSGAAETINVTTLARAAVPTSPSSRGAPVVIGVGLLFGLLGGIGLVTLAELLDDRIRTTGELRDVTSGQVLGDLAPRGTDRVGRPKAVEPVRQLRTNLATVLERQGKRTVLITSPTRHDGRTSTAVALAEAFAAAGSRVVLVDADLRHPGVATRLPVRATPGVGEVVSGSAPLAAALQRAHVEGLFVITAGTAPTDPGPLLASPGMSRMLDELSTSFDVVLIDGPDLLSTADAASLGQQVDGALLLARHGRTRAPQLRQASQALALADVRVLGAVLNRVGRVRQGTHLRLTPQPLSAARPAAGEDQEPAGLLSERDDAVARLRGLPAGPSPSEERDDDGESSPLSTRR